MNTVPHETNAQDASHLFVMCIVVVGSSQTYICASLAKLYPCFSSQTYRHAFLFSFLLVWLFCDILVCSFSSIVFDTWFSALLFLSWHGFGMSMRVGLCPCVYMSYLCWAMGLFEVHASCLKFMCKDQQFWI